MEDRRVVQNHHHAVLPADAELAEERRGAGGEAGDVRERQRAELSEQRRLVGPPGLEVVVEQAADIDSFR